MNVVVQAAPVYKVYVTGVNSYRVVLTQTILQGPQGEQGDTGAQGEPGPQGEQGLPGVNAVDSVNGQTGTVVLDMDDIGDGTTNKGFTSTEKTKLSGIANGATANSSDATLLARANHTGTQSADTLTDGTTNKAFLATERTKLSGIATGATANDTDANLKARANHTGTQTASTISDFDTEVSNNTDVAAATAHLANTSNPHSVTKAQVGLSNVDNTSDATKNAASVTLTNKTLTSPAINTPTGIVKGDVGLGNVDNTADTAKPVSTAQQTALDLKVDKSGTKVLSDENYTTAEKTKLSGIATGATANSSDATLLARANHTGTQLASTISDFNSAALLASPAETTTTEGALINGAAAKTTPVDADYVGLMDSAASNVLKKLSWANIKATVKTYFDTLYATITHTHTQSDITNLTTDLGNKQPLDADLTTIAGLTATTDNFMVSVSSAWASRTPAQAKTTLSLNNVENTALSTWAGSTSITTLGTISTGTVPVGNIGSLGTGVATALGVNIGSAGAPVLFNGAGGTPSSLTLTNATGLPQSGVTSLTSDLALKAPLASPALTGSPTAPTQSANDNSTKIATTAYVDDRYTESVRIMRSLGSAIIAEPYGVTRGTMNTAGNTLTDGQIYVIACEIPTATLTGVVFYSSTAGVFTADNENAVALYTRSGTTLNRVAISANDGNIWKQTGASMRTIAFTGTYAATKQTYYIALIYNSSAQPTPPAIGGGTLASANMNVGDITSGIKIYGTVNGTSLGTSIDMTTLASSSLKLYLAPY